VVHSKKDQDGNWNEFSRTVTTVVQRDEDGYPYGPLRYNYGLGPFSYGQRPKSGLLGDYIAWYDSLNASPAKKDEQEPEDGQDG
jgi:hypothetical protein